MGVGGMFLLLGTTHRPGPARTRTVLPSFPSVRQTGIQLMIIADQRVKSLHIRYFIECTVFTRCCTSPTLVVDGPCQSVLHSVSLAHAT